MTRTRSIVPLVYLTVGFAVAGGEAAQVQVWNQSVLRRVQVTDFGKPHEPLRPLSLVGVRNGRFSCQVVAGSPTAITGIQVAASDLKMAANEAVIPASAVQIRYALPDDHEAAAAFKRRWNDTVPPFFGSFAAEAPAEVPVPAGAAGCVQPIWITVSVPRDAKPGDYKGTLTVRADGATPVEVPLTITVHNWVLPDPKQFATHVGLVQSPESVALRYGVTLWSDEHWKLLEKTFELMGQVGAKDLYIPLIRQVHWGNEHTMVFWVRQPDGTTTHDFSVVERYVDLAVKYLGEVPVVCLYAWAPFTGSKYMDPKHGHKPNVPLPFTVRDPATGALTAAEGPMWGTPEVRAFWKPVFEGLRERLAARGLADSMLIGLSQDNVPNQDAVDDLKAAAPEIKWAAFTHSGYNSVRGVPVGYRASVWSIGMAPDPATGHRYYGWMAPPPRVVVFPRYGSGAIGHSLTNRTSLVVYRLATEASITGGYGRGADVWRRIKGRAADLRGIGMMGVDFWPCIKDRRGRRLSLIGRYPTHRSGPNIHQSVTALLAPGKTGPAATIRFETFREGLQEAEARISIEKALTDPARRARLSLGLADRCQAVLDERIRAMRAGLPPFRGGSGGKETEPSCLKFIASGWHQRSRDLYAAAAEVAAAVTPN